MMPVCEMATQSRFFQKQGLRFDRLTKPDETPSFRHWFEQTFEIGASHSISKAEVETQLKQFGVVNIRSELKRMQVAFTYDAQERCTIKGERWKGFYHGFGLKALHVEVVATPVKSHKMKIPKKVRSDVWNTYIGVDINKHKCLCCKSAYICCNVDFAVGHVISEKDGGTLEISNLRPICAPCNSAMGTMNMVDFIKKFGYYL